MHLRKVFELANRPRPSLRRDLFWLCRRHVGRDDDVGVAARKLLAGPFHHISSVSRPHLQTVLDATWELSPFGFYTSSLRAQGAAFRIAERLKEAAA
jgi:hypothetical protein